MCLSTVDKEINKKALKREGKYVVCWKVVHAIKLKQGYYSEFWGTQTPFNPGWNISDQEISKDGYVPHFHAFMRKSAAYQWAYGLRVIKCKTYLKYITTTGRQAGYGRVLVTSKIWIPKYPARE